MTVELCLDHSDEVRGRDRVSLSDDVIATGGTRAVAAQTAGVHPGTLYEWLRRAAENNTQTALNPDDYTTRELRALGKTAHVPGYSRLRKAELATAIAAKRSPYSEFSDTIKKAEAKTEVEWLSEIARIGRGDHLETVTTEEYDAAGNLKTRTTVWMRSADGGPGYSRSWLPDARGRARPRMASRNFGSAESVKAVGLVQSQITVLGRGEVEHRPRPEVVVRRQP